MGEQQKLLTRREAAAYLSEVWFSITVNTLNNYASKKIGPPYMCRGESGLGPSYYRRDDLDSWAEWFLLPPDKRPSLPAKEQKSGKASITGQPTAGHA